MNFDESLDSDEIPAANRTLLHQSSAYFSAILLSRWDNILGPQVHHVWHAEDQLVDGVVQYVANHTLNGEIGRNDTSEPGKRITTKLCLFTERETVAVAFIFKGYSTSSNSARSKYRSSTTKSLFSMCLLLPMSKLKSYLPLHDLCDVRMRMYIPQLVHLQEQDATLAKFDKLIIEFVGCIAKITKKPLTDMQFQSTVLKNIGDVQKCRFLERCITSHLQTCGCSIVVGNTLEEVDEIISILAMFLSPSERSRSQCAVEGKQFRYESDLFLQGLTLEKGKLSNEKIPEMEVIRTQLPSTLIDVCKREVKQTNQLHKHTAMRKDMITNEQIKDETGFYANVFRPMEDHSKLVRTFLHEISLLPPVCGVREAYASQFVRLVQRKALALIKYVEAESPRPHQGVALDPASSHTLVKKLKRALSLDEEGDWKIVLATAEKLKPGMFRHVLGDPSEHCQRVEQELAFL